MANNGSDLSKLTKEQLVERLKIAEAKNGGGKLTCKVSQKGAISVYGLQRMPVTLYDEQWTRLLDYGDEIRAFQAAHQGELKHKD